MAARKQSKSRDQQNPTSDVQADAGGKHQAETINATDSSAKNTTTDENPDTDTAKTGDSNEDPVVDTVDASKEPDRIMGEGVDANQTVTEPDGTTKMVVKGDDTNYSEQLHAAAISPENTGDDSAVDGHGEGMHEPSEEPIFPDNKSKTVPTIVDPVSRPPLPMGTPLTTIDGKTDLSVDPGTPEQIPQEVLQRQAKKEMIHEPTNTRMQAPANPFMREEARRKAAQVHASSVTSDDIAKIIEDKGIVIGENYMLRMLVNHLNDYVETMGPNVPVSDTMGIKMQQQLAGDIFGALEASPQESSAALKVIEQYFKEYNNHAFARSHAFRFMDKVAMDHQKGLAFQSLLHLFIELANPRNRKRKEIAREVSIRKIADYMPGNTDAQLRLTEFMS